MNLKMKKHTAFICRAAVIAALYVVLTWLSAQFGLASGTIQFRLSEALCVLPIFTSAAIPGLAIGCLLANLLTGAVVWDVIFGSLATLIGAVVARMLKRLPFLAPIPTIISNMVIVPFVLRFAYGVPDAIWFLMITVGIGEIVCCGGLGTLLYLALKPRKKLFE